MIERQVGLDVELCLQFFDEFGIWREGDVVGGVERRGFQLGREAVALFERGHFERVDGVDEAIELVGERAFALEVHAGAEHGVDGEVEVHAGGFEAVGAVVVDAGGVARFGLVDELLGLGGVRIGLLGGSGRGGRLRRVLTGRCGLRGCRRCDGGCGLFGGGPGGRAGGTCKRIVGGAAGEQQRHGTAQERGEQASGLRMGRQAIDAVHSFSICGRWLSPQLLKDEPLPRL